METNLPSDEHYRRSSDCSFFVFAQPPAKKGKGSRSKKARTSKASSRVSTQSVATTASEEPEMDVDESMDQSMMSQATVKPKSMKRATKGKGKTAKSKKGDVELESQIDIDETESAQPESSKPKSSSRGKKRVSEEMNNGEPEMAATEERQHFPPPAEPPTKRRATRTRSSSVSQTYAYDQPDHAMPEAASVDGSTQGEETTKKGRKKKGPGSKSRKGSDVSVASKSTSKARVPRDSELDAALEAGLEADAPVPAEPEPEPEKPRTSKKTKASKKSKAVAKSSEPEEDQVHHVDVHKEQPDVVEEPTAVENEAPEEPASKSKTTKTSKKGTKKTKKEESAKAKENATAKQGSPERNIADDKDESEHHESFVSVEIVKREPVSQPEPEGEPTEKPAAKKASKKENKSKKSKKTKKTEQTPPEPAHDQHDFRSPSPDEDVFGTPDDIPDQVEMVSAPQPPSPEPQQAHQKTPVPPKTTKRFSDIPQDERFAQSLSESQRSGSTGRQDGQGLAPPSNRAVSPLPAAHQSTPSLSPQSSDAENRPPSSRPSSSRPPVLSASKEQNARTPRAVSTPSPSKRNANAGFPPSTHPWTPVDIDEVLYGDSSDMENSDLNGIFKNVKGTLTSPEKKMTVEEWIMWNAKNGEERLKRECEHLVGQFEKEGGRAMQRLEAIECID